MTTTDLAASRAGGPPTDDLRIRWLLIGCAIVAGIVGAVGQIMLPARGNPLTVWLVTAGIPAVVALLFILNRRDRLPLTIVACALLYLEAILTASQFVIGIAFAILVPIIGIGLVRPHVRGRWSVLAYAGAGISATVAVALVEAGVPTNSIESDAHVLTVVAFGLVAAASLGLLWRAGEQQARALAAADREIAGRIEAEERRAALEAQLRQAQKMEAVGHLAGGVAHDINNTLTAIGGFAELIAGAATDPDVVASARTIRASVERGSGLTRQLLAFARRSVLQPRVVEVGAFLDALAERLRQVLGDERPLAIRDETGENGRPARVYVDPTELEQALLNLVSNARDAMPDGGTLTINVRRRSGPDDRALVEVAVADTGAGIPVDIQDHVFEPFFTTKDVGEGSGLGLAMVYGFVTQSRGMVSLRSMPEVGTTVELLLPEAAVAESVEASATAVPPARQPQRAGTETVLLVDDDAAVLRFAETVLTRLGYTVLASTDAVAAIELAISRMDPIDLIVSDVMMPGIQGPEVVARVRAGHPEAAVLYASGYAAEAIADEGVLPSGVRLLEKPFSATELGDRVRTAIDAARSPRPQLG